MIQCPICHGASNEIACTMCAGVGFLTEREYHEQRRAFAIGKIVDALQEIDFERSPDETLEEFVDLELKQMLEPLSQAIINALMPSVEQVKKEIHDPEIPF